MLNHFAFGARMHKNVFLLIEEPLVCYHLHENVITWARWEQFCSFEIRIVFFCPQATKFAIKTTSESLTGVGFLVSTSHALFSLGSCRDLKSLLYLFDKLCCLSLGGFTQLNWARPFSSFQLSIWALSKCVLWPITKYNKLSKYWPNYEKLETQVSQQLLSRYIKFTEQQHLLYAINLLDIFLL